MVDNKASEVADKFDRFKNNDALTNYIDKPSLKALIGDITDKTIIEYGCRTGQYTRMFGQNAKLVIGVDESSEMIEQALRLRRHNSISYHLQDIRDIQYYVRDCKEILDLGKHDIVVSTFFLCHAVNRQMLKRIVKSMYESLKPGGSCYALTTNFFLKPEELRCFKKYNIEVTLGSNLLTEGTQIYVTVMDCKTREPLFKVVDYYIEPSLIEKTFLEVGFINFKWVPMSLREEYKDYEVYFDDYFKHPWSIMLSAEKPSK